MGPSPQAPLADAGARREAITAHNKSILIEAGAGSGKTSVMAGRIAMLLAGGIKPKCVAAVTFTELAASELLIRVRSFVDQLVSGHIPTELRTALPDGLSNDQHDHLSDALRAIDDITCSTIHGFCQRLIRPYPVEADIDPGASVMDSDEADLVFREIVDTWLREELSGESGGLLAELILHDPDQTMQLIRNILDHLRDHPDIRHDVPEELEPMAVGFRKAVEEFSTFIEESNVDEEETETIQSRFRELVETLEPSQVDQAPVAGVKSLFVTPHSDLVTATGSFRKYQKKGKWGTAAIQAGLSKADGDLLNVRASAHYDKCCEAWNQLPEAAASCVLAELIPLTRPVIKRFLDYKRSAALLDFDDLIVSARNLLRDHDQVRRALARRFTHVLVDEFQDTDPLQTEIFWRLCGEPPANGKTADWTSFELRPGALFLVGDPKQAIYRFRGADIATYLKAREAFREHAPDSILTISTNFRSCEPILSHVNKCFEHLLSEEEGQPGFQKLDAFQPEREEGPSVAALEISVADEEGKADATQRRDGEAEAVAGMCARLIGSEAVRDAKSGENRPCRAGDIALLAPTGNDLWRYEEALERRGIPVATQAGKGLFRRQEIQDLIAVTRVLADQRDTLALGALLRGPVVGLTEEQLLDIVWKLPRLESDPDRPRRLDLGVPADEVSNPDAREIIERLQALRRRVNATTPHDLLSQAVDALRIRPILLQRHRGQAERALANVDLYLSFSRAYSVRGFRAFAQAMTDAWSDETRAVEGRPDAQEESVALYTMHAAKGLEWPIVVPINTMTQIKGPESAITDRNSGCFHSKVFGSEPIGYSEAREAERAELNRERIRLWYVTTTRARELLVLPKFDVEPGKSAWCSLVDLSLAELPTLALDDPDEEVDSPGVASENEQTRELFASEAAMIVECSHKIDWRTPSRDEHPDGPVLRKEAPELLVIDGDGAQADNNIGTAIQGGRDRGLILHKLVEEALTGEIAATTPDLVARANDLIGNLGHTATDDAASGLAPTELADCVMRTLSLPEIAALRPRLKPEFPVYASRKEDMIEEVTAGIADAIAFDSRGAPEVVIDWKSDVDPSPETLERYRNQVRAYLDVTGARRGLVVAMTSGEVIPVTAPL